MRLLLKQTRYKKDFIEGSFISTYMLKALHKRKASFCGISVGWSDSVIRQGERLTERKKCFSTFGAKFKDSEPLGNSKRADFAECEALKGRRHAVARTNWAKTTVKAKYLSEWSKIQDSGFCVGWSIWLALSKTNVLLFICSFSFFDSDAIRKERKWTKRKKRRLFYLIV